MKGSPHMIDEELYKRILLTHRFGLSLSHTTFKNTVYSVEELPFDIALAELKRSFSEFITSKDHIEKFLNILRYTLNNDMAIFNGEFCKFMNQSIS